MKTLKKLGYACLAILTLTFTLSSCSDDDEVSGTGSATFEVADAPIDNAEVNGVFVTITDVKINGETASSFTGATTVDLLALQEGRTEVLAEEDLDAGTYSNITFTIDLATDADGNSPGSYVMTTNGKQALELDGQDEIELVASGSYEILANTTNNFVVDFDLRKMIKAEGSGVTSDDNYTLVTKSEADAALRIVTKQNAGNIVGTVDMSEFEGADKVIVYAYKKGTFNAETEAQGQGQSQIEFANAVSSSVVKGNLTNTGTFELNFMTEGEYELVYAAYNEDPVDESFEFESYIETSMGVEGEVSDLVTVTANADLSLTLIFGAFID